jgi:hypothetical protein
MLHLIMSVVFVVKIFEHRCSNQITFHQGIHLDLVVNTVNVQVNDLKSDAQLTVENSQHLMT